jgi:protein-disulfide isomerase
MWRERAVAKSRKAPAASSPNRLYLLLGVVGVAVVAGILFFAVSGGGAATAPVDISTEPAELQRAQGVPMGREDARVVVWEFADYQCPACANFASFGHPLLKERFIDTGLIRLIRYDFPLVGNHPNAFIASRAARCVGPERYWEFHDILYGRQPIWSVQRDPSAEFEQYAELVGVDRRTFRQCLQSDQHAEEVTRNLRLGESLGVNGTPTLMMNGQRLPMNYSELEEFLNQATGRNAPAAEAPAAAAPPADGS